MRPFYLILSTYLDGEMGASDPRLTLDDAADEYGEAHKLPTRDVHVLLICPDAGSVTDVTNEIASIIVARARRYVA